MQPAQNKDISAPSGPPDLLADDGRVERYVGGQVDTVRVSDLVREALARSSGGE